MRLGRLYFCYGAILTSVVWLSIILIYFTIQEAQITSLQHDRGSESDVSNRRPVISQSEQSSLRNNTLLLPDLDGLALVHSMQDKVLRADGNSHLLFHCS